MTNRITHCPLTGYQLSGNWSQLETTAPVFSYLFPPIGKATIALSTIYALRNEQKYSLPDVAGICRNCFENKEEPPLISTEFLSTGIKNVSFPKTFKEKASHLIQYMAKRGGDDYALFNFSSTIDYPLVYADGQEEFKRILKYLKEEYLINIENELRVSGDRVQYKNVTLTKSGIQEAQKHLPQMPLVSLVNQEITTGDSEVDQMINHAKKLFFTFPQTMDNMRSACESLCYVLEPLRSKLTSVFTDADVNTFFQMVNTFDIRHNKDSTKRLLYPEQLEWVFYTLLNTINTYTKLKNH
jgi:hypothetical protein